VSTGLFRMVILGIDKHLSFLHLDLQAWRGSQLTTEVLPECKKEANQPE